jgi:hypothetical protein
MGIFKLGAHIMMVGELTNVFVGLQSETTNKLQAKLNNIRGI